MYRNPFIKKFFGILLFAAFALSNTPIKVLHYLFANHVDYVNHHLSDSKTPQLNTAGIDCHCQTNVVVSPYTYVGYLSTSKEIQSFHSFNSRSFVISPFTRKISFGLRGPPSEIA
ncbi:MAG: hypothetical protein ABI266_00645 [Ginsengibacter sp.]